MSAAGILGLGISLSLALMVFSVTLTFGHESLWGAFRSRSLLIRSLVAMFVVMPLVAALIAKYLDLNRALLIALLLLALSPVPPVLPSKQIKAGGSASYSLALLVCGALAAIVIVPLGVEAIGLAFGRELDVSHTVVLKPVATSILAPVVLGLAVARLAPGFAARAAGPAGRIAGVLLVASFLPVLWISGSSIFAQMTNFTAAAIVAFTGVGLLVGHLLGGPDPDDRTVLALATATRHPGVAIGVLNAIEPASRDVVLVILLYLIVGIAATAPYVRWRRRAQGALKAG